MTIVLNPGEVTLRQWRDIYEGAEVALDRSCRPLVEASAAAVARIVARGAPVYGINTGFGKLANIKIEAADLATLQRNIVLSHAAGVGEPMPCNIARLMMALKLASLAQGASGIAPRTLDLSTLRSSRPGPTTTIICWFCSCELKLTVCSRPSSGSRTVAVAITHTRQVRPSSIHGGRNAG